MTASEIFNNMKATAKENTNKVGYVYYIEFSSARKLTNIEIMINKFEDDSDIDCELGIISHDEHIKEMIMVKIMRDSLRTARERI